MVNDVKLTDLRWRKHQRIWSGRIGHLHILGVERFAEKNLTVQFSTHGSARARTAVQLKSDNASAIWFVINNTI